MSRVAQGIWGAGDLALAEAGLALCYKRNFRICQKLCNFRVLKYSVRKAGS